MTFEGAIRAPTLHAHKGSAVLWGMIHSFHTLRKDLPSVLRGYAGVRPPRRAPICIASNREGLCSVQADQRGINMRGTCEISLL